ncbi:hypothetical protein JXA80_09295 [bacterium]|nr:hypothetical protein [candidate division CSSED10-310 bacterium]
MAARLRIKIGILLLTGCIVLIPWLGFLDPGWIQILAMGDFILILFYRFRMIREIKVSRSGVSETLGRRCWEWSWDDVSEIRETRATRIGSVPGRRLSIEHESTHDMSVDDEMPGYDDVVTIIRAVWEDGEKRRIRIQTTPFFLFRYW